MKFAGIVLLACAGLTVAQVSDVQPPAISQPAPSGNQAAAGKDAAPLDQLVFWDGRKWSVRDDRVFQARFRKYLEAPPQITQSDKEYQATLSGIMACLASGETPPQSIDEAFILLVKASQFAQDDHLSHQTAFNVLGAWLVLNRKERTIAAHVILEKERKRLEQAGKAILAADTAQGGSDKDGAAKREMELQPILTRLIEIQALIKAGEFRREVSVLGAQIEFQYTIITHFLQRRFQHAMIGILFYRTIYPGDGRLLLNPDSETAGLFRGDAGKLPTMSTLDSLTREAIRKADEGVESCKTLLEKGEQETASKRLREAFMSGEYLPSVRTLDSEAERKVLAFIQRSEPN